MSTEDMTIEEMTNKNKSELKKSLEGNDWVLPTDINLLLPATEALVKKLTEANVGWDKESPEVDEIKTGFGEALVNAIAHGNLGITKPDGGTETIFQLAQKKQKLFATSKKVFIHLEIDKDRVLITIRDQGKGFDIDEVTNPKVEGLMSESGRGILLMKTVYFNSVTYTYNEEGDEEGNEEGNVVTLVKEKKKL
jgi:anti-sigma regulatory factor (Ser/Thr protein kinase)